jgi:hypothetical protein
MESAERRIEPTARRNRFPPPWPKTAICQWPADCPLATAGSSDVVAARPVIAFDDNDIMSETILLPVIGLNISRLGR